MAVTSAERELLAAADIPSDEEPERGLDHGVFIPFKLVYPGFRSTELDALDGSVGRDDDLPEAGLSSLDMVNLMLAVEAEFDLKIPDRDMIPANFRSIARIEALVHTLAEKV